MLILWLHGLIAYTLYAYTVQKARACVCGVCGLSFRFLHVPILVATTNK